MVLFVSEINIFYLSLHRFFFMFVFNILSTTHYSIFSVLLFKIKVGFQLSTDMTFCGWIAFSLANSRPEDSFSCQLAKQSLAF